MKLKLQKDWWFFILENVTSHENNVYGLLTKREVKILAKLDIKYILTTAGAAKLKKYYEHISGVTAIFSASLHK